jgi:hypothetical protein
MEFHKMEAGNTKKIAADVKKHLNKKERSA